MTLKERAQQLVDKFYIEEIKYYENRTTAKQCALIAVDEMFEEINKWSGGGFQKWEKERWRYLLEVKKEIEKL